MSRIQSKDHRKRTYKINKISLSCFDNQIYIQNKYTSKYNQIYIQHLIIKVNYEKQLT